MSPDLASLLQVAREAVSRAEVSDQLRNTTHSLEPLMAARAFLAAVELLIARVQ